MGKKIRRTTKELDDLLLDVVKELIEEIGFPNITISSVVHKAEIEPISFYNRFSDITELFDKYVRTYDYWINDLFYFNPIKNTSKQNCINLLNGLIDALNRDVSMQRILAWEVAEDNYITRRTARTREAHTEPLIEYFAKNYSDDLMDVRVVFALMIAGICYLCLHKNLSTFCGISFQTEKGMELLKKNIVELVNRIYLKSDSDDKKLSSKTSNIKKSIRIAYEKGINIDTIKDIFGISVEEINLILGFGNNENNDIIEIPVKRKRGRPKKINY